MRKIVLIGIGTGNPRHLTVEGMEALSRSDIVFIPTKGEEKTALAAIRRDICTAYLGPSARTVEFELPVRDAGEPDYEAGVNAWHGRIADQYATMIGAMGEAETGALLVWGDPGLYDSTLRILEKVRASGVDFDVQVIPGITAIQALTAAFAIPLNTVGNPVTITTGRRLMEAWPRGADSVIVMLDGQKAFTRIDPQGVHIYWGAYVGMEQQVLIEGSLADVAARISAARDALRALNGWIMDVYLLRKS